MIKKAVVILMLSVILIAYYSSIKDTYDEVNSYSKNYFISNTLYETGSQNIITGIYLDYRLFDSIFEASILLIAVTGIIFMSKKDDEVL